MHKSNNEVLTYIREFADNAHGSQVRKYTGERYIGHPVRVMETVKQFNPEVTVLAAALLHDVLEDTPIKAQGMELALLTVLEPTQANKTVQMVIELTDIFIKNDFPRLNRRTRKQREALRLSAISPEAQTIKYADIIDNVTDIVNQDADFARVFVREAKEILTGMTAGNAILRQHAIALVDTCLLKLPRSAEAV